MTQLIFNKEKKYQTIDVTSSTDIVDNSFQYSSKEDIEHFCKILKNHAKNGSDIQGYIYIKNNK
jgi:hypothetical protein